MSPDHDNSKLKYKRRHQHKKHDPKDSGSKHPPENHDHTRMRQGPHHQHMIQDYQRRFYVSLIFTVPVFFLSHMVQGILGFHLTFPGDLYLQFLFSSIIFFYGGYPFFKGIWGELRNHTPGMMTLVSLLLQLLTCTVRP